MENESLKAKTERRNAQSRVIKIITLASMFIALEVVTEYYLSFTMGVAYRVSLTFLIRTICGHCIGIVGGAVAAIADLIGGFVFYGGSLNPWLTLVRFLQGFCAGLFLYRKLTPARIVVSAVVCTLLLNIAGAFARFLYQGTPLNIDLFIPSTIVYSVSTVAEIVIMFALAKTLMPRLRSLLYNAGVWKPDTVSEQ